MFEPFFLLFSQSPLYVLPHGLAQYTMCRVPDFCASWSHVRQRGWNGASCQELVVAGTAETRSLMLRRRHTSSLDGSYWYSYPGNSSSLPSSRAPSSPRLCSSPSSSSFTLTMGINDIGKEAPLTRLSVRVRKLHGSFVGSSLECCQV